MLKNNLVLSDVDGTIVKGSLVLDHACHLHDLGVADFGDLPELWKDDPKNGEFIFELSQVYRHAITGKKWEDLYIDDFLTHGLPYPDKFYSTIDRLIQHYENGDEVVLISGSPDFLVAHFAEFYGFKGFGSTYYRDEKGVFTGELYPMFHSENKKEVVSNFDLSSYKKVIAYGDTKGDIALWEASDHAVLVDPSYQVLVDLASISFSEIIHS